MTQYFRSVIVALLVLMPVASVRADRPPNVILILIDDMGWTDLSCYGSKFYETPNIDKLAASGTRFTNGYSACTVCSPTRAAVMTGKYPARLHITDWIAGHNRPFAKLKPPEWQQHLPLEETTIAEVFQKAGYVTCHIGKWHLGDEAYWPLTQGFDINIGGNHRGQPPSYFFPYERNGIKLPGLAEGKPDEYLTDRLTDEAIAFVMANREKPFFLYLPHYGVHTPLQAKPEKIAKYQAKAKAQVDNPQHNATYAAMIESLDEGIGRLMEHLDVLMLRENTIVIFTSDNGGLELNQVTDNAPLRDGKGSAYEGGVRVPFIFSHPAEVKAGTVSDAPVMSLDLLPTLNVSCRLGHSERAWNGVDMWGALGGRGGTLRDALFWHYPHYHPGGATPYGAVRVGDWRLVEFFEDNRVELYNLREDIGETRDLAIANAAKRGELLSRLQAWRKKVGAQMPLANPDYNATKDAERPAKKKAKAT